MFCEKPVGINSYDIELSIIAIEKYNSYIQVGFNRRFDNSIIKLREKIITMGNIPHILRITSRDSESPNEQYISKSGGIFFDMAIHDFDMARYLFDSEIVEVYSTGSCLINPNFKKFNDVDTSITQIKFANGSIGSIDNSRCASYGYDQRVEVFSNKGNYFSNNYYKNNVKKFTSHGICSSTLKHFFLDRYDQAYDNQLNTFFECIEKKMKSPVDIYDGYKAVKISQAAHSSLKENRPFLV